MPLDPEWSTYLDHLPELAQHNGKFVLIKAYEICGIFPDLGSALGEGYERFAVDPFLAHQIQSVEHPHMLTRLARPDFLPE